MQRGTVERATRPRGSPRSRCPCRTAVRRALLSARSPTRSRRRSSSSGASCSPALSALVLAARRSGMAGRVAARAADPAARARGRPDRRRARSTSRSWTRGSDELGELAAAFERMRMRLAQLDHARREFIANASHELRTPLFSLGGFLELLGDEELDEATRREFLDDDARAGRAADEARHRPARPLPARRRAAARRARAGRPRRRSPGTLADEFARASRSAGGTPLDVDVPTAPSGRSATRSACSRSAGRSSRTRSCTRPRGRGCRSGPAPTASTRCSGRGRRPGHPAPSMQTHVFERFYRVEGARRLRQRARARDRARARGADGRRRSSSSRGPAGRCSRSLPASTPRARAASGARRAAARFHVKTAAAPAGYSEPMRPGAARRRRRSPPRASARPRSCSSARAAGWRTTAETVVVPSSTRRRRRRPARGVRSTAPPLGNGFDPARIYAAPLGRASSRSTPFFGDVADERCAGLRLRRLGRGHDPHERARGHERRRGGRGRCTAPTASTSSSRDGDRVAGEDRRLGPLRRRRRDQVDPAAHALAPVPLGDSSRVVVGEPVAAIGSPFGNESSLSVGVVSATQRSIDVADLALQRSPTRSRSTRRSTTATPAARCFDAAGRVIGINAQIRSDYRQRGGCGLRGPDQRGAALARRSSSRTGKVSYAYVGVTTEDLTPGDRRARFGSGARAAR